MWGWECRCPERLCVFLVQCRCEFVGSGSAVSVQDLWVLAGFVRVGYAGCVCCVYRLCVHVVDLFLVGLWGRVGWLCAGVC